MPDQNGGPASAGTGLFGPVFGRGGAVVTRAADAADFGPAELAELGRAAVLTGNPVPGLARVLARRVTDPAARSAVHQGATSQDIMDTAAMLIARDALGAAIADLTAAASAAARLADENRGTLMIGRTLLQQAVPTTFGVVAAGWLAGLDSAIEGLACVRGTRLAVQYGGAAGTLASLGGDGAAGAPRRGGSSAMPNKSNPVAAVAILGCAKQAPGLTATLLASAEQEYQRAAGAWHAEWQPYGHLLQLAVSAAAWARDLLENLDVDKARMAANLAEAGGLPLAERV